MNVTLKGNKLIIEVDANTVNPPPSKSSGKSLIVASTNGNARTNVLVMGKPLTIGLNCYISAA